MAYKYTFSILIPSLRPEKLKECINAIKENTIIDYEILVNNEPYGIYKGVNKLFKESQGEYIVHIPDDCLPQKKWLEEMLILMKEHDNEIFEGAFRTYNEHENPHGEYYYFGKKFAGFICIRKDVANKLGGLLDERYISFYGDPDLSLRVYELGGTVKYTNKALIYYYDKHDDIKINNLSMYEKQDEQKFKERWEPIFGEYKGCERIPFI